MKMWMLLWRLASSASVPAQQKVSSSGCGVNRRMVLFSVFSSATRCADAMPTNTSNAAAMVCIRISDIMTGLALAGFPGRDLLVEFRRPVAGNAERVPAVVSEMLRQQDDLPDVVRIMRDLAVDRLHHRVRLASNRDCAVHIRFRQRLERAKHSVPSVFPQCQQGLSRLRRRFEFGIAIAIRLFTV